MIRVRNMSDKPETKPPVPWVLISVILVLAGVGAYIVKNILSDDSQPEKSHIAAVTLVKPPSNPPLRPSPSIAAKEKPAGRERLLKVEESSGPVMQVEGQAPRNAGTAGDARGVRDEGVEGDSSGIPAGDTLGMDAEGGAGGDSFGLVGRKGGRSILARAGGSKVAAKIPFQNQFGEYIRIVTAEIKDKVMKLLAEAGGIPQGKLQCIIRVRVDNDGKIIDYRIKNHSGNTRMDQAVINALRSCQFSEPPPEFMPRMMDIMITSQG